MNKKLVWGMICAAILITFSMSYPVHATAVDNMNFEMRGTYARVSNDVGEVFWKRNFGINCGQVIVGRIVGTKATVGGVEISVRTPKGLVPVEIRDMKLRKLLTTAFMAGMRWRT